MKTQRSHRWLPPPLDDNEDDGDEWKITVTDDENQE